MWQKTTIIECSEPSGITMNFQTLNEESLSLLNIQARNTISLSATPQKLNWNEKRIL